MSQQAYYPTPQNALKSIAGTISTIYRSKHEKLFTDNFAGYAPNSFVYKYSFKEK